MRVLVTGANGFIGRVLVRRLLATGLGGTPVDRLVALDLGVDQTPEASADSLVSTDPQRRMRAVTGSIADADTLALALADPVDVVFHLASVPGGAAEKDPALGRRINLDATLQLLDRLQAQGNAPRLVFASTVAVYGDPLPAMVDEDTAPRPVMSYGAHKLAAEILIADATRRQAVQGLSLRLPGVVARPGDGAGLMSAFMSQLFWRLQAGEPIVLPVEAQGMAWWISVATCVDNLLHAATLDTSALAPQRVVQMPALHLSMQAVVDALAQTLMSRLGEDRRPLVRYAPQALVQRLFASFPPLHTPRALALGFAHDGSAEALVARALAG